MRGVWRVTHWKRNASGKAGWTFSDINYDTFFLLLFR